MYVNKIIMYTFWKYLSQQSRIIVCKINEKIK